MNFAFNFSAQDLKEQLVPVLMGLAPEEQVRKSALEILGEIPLKGLDGVRLMRHEPLNGRELLTSWVQPPQPKRPPLWSVRRHDPPLWRLVGAHLTDNPSIALDDHVVETLRELEKTLA